MSERDEVDALVRELFGLMEQPQGLFNVSDGETFATQEEFFDRVRGRLSWGGPK